MNKIVSVALLAIVFASCQNATEKETTTSDSVINSTSTTTVATPAPADPNSLNAIVNAPAGATPAPAAAAAPATGGSAAGGLNPAHGAPGHRCDIAVGAPLSTPVSAAAPATTASPSMMQQQAPAQPAMAQPTSGSGRTNPPHGAPGHDCGVPVGAPLKS